MVILKNTDNKSTQITLDTINHASGVGVRVMMQYFVVSGALWLRFGLGLGFTNTNKNAKNTIVCYSAPKITCPPVLALKATRARAVRPRSRSAADSVLHNRVICGVSAVSALSAFFMMTSLARQAVRRRSTSRNIYSRSSCHVTCVKLRVPQYWH